MDRILKNLIAAALIDDGWNADGAPKQIYEKMFKGFINHYLGGWDAMFSDPQVLLGMQIRASPCNRVDVIMSQEDRFGCQGE